VTACKTVQLLLVVTKQLRVVVQVAVQVAVEGCLCGRTNQAIALLSAIGSQLAPINQIPTAPGPQLPLKT
jgi:hypothetical protein